MRVLPSSLRSDVLNLYSIIYTTKELAKNLFRHQIFCIILAYSCHHDVVGHLCISSRCSCVKGGHKMLSVILFILSLQRDIYQPSSNDVNMSQIHSRIPTCGTPYSGEKFHIKRQNWVVLTGV